MLGLYLLMVAVVTVGAIPHDTPPAVDLRAPLEPRLRTPLEPRLRTPLPPRTKMPLEPRLRTPLPPRMRARLEPRLRTPLPPRIRTPLEPRQADDDIVPLVPCTGSPSLVTACETTDLTSANWVSFDIDGYLLNFMGAFGTTDDFPNFFVSQHISPDHSNVNFLCTTMDSDATCTHPSVLNTAAIDTDCAFQDIPHANETDCAAYIAPEAAFIVQNYINYWQSVQNNFRAIEDAGDNISRTGFVDTIVSGLTPRNESISEEIFELLASLAVAFLPLGREVAAVGEFMEAVGGVLEVAVKGTDIVKESQGLVEVVQANHKETDKAKSINDQVKQQVQNIVTGTQAFMQTLLDHAFGPNPVDSRLVSQDARAIDTTSLGANVLRFASQGRWLDNVPARSDLAAQMEVNLKHWIVSRVLKAQGYSVVVDTTLPEADLDIQIQACARSGGALVSAGCAQLRSRGGNTPEDPTVLASQIDFDTAMTNAQACEGSVSDFSSFLDPTRRSQGLPACLYDFPVEIAKL